MEWSRDGGEFAEVVRRQTQACLAVYREDPSRITQDANNELRIREGGYRDRQLIELLQNAIDAEGRRIEVRLVDDTLYVANDGKPFDARGIAALMASDLSSKTDVDIDHIGRFGIGFKSVLAISSGPRVYSRSVSFAFDASSARRRIEEEGFSNATYPTMRVAEVVDPRVDKRGDAHLQELMTWATTIVCLPLMGSEVGDKLEAEIRGMKGRFLLFSSRVDFARLSVTGARDDFDKVITRQSTSPWQTRLCENGEWSDWLVLSTRHRPTARAKAAAGRLADRETIPLSWALPMDRLGELGEFWTYFPTKALTTLSGLINAPWQVSDDRLNLLETDFNRELLTEVLPKLLVENLDKIHSGRKPTRVLDLLPARGRESRSWADDSINGPMMEAAWGTACLPDLNGRLRRPVDLLVPPPTARREWLDQWEAAHGLDRSRWIHSEALSTPERRHKVVRLITEDKGAKGGRPSTPPQLAHLWTWLEAAAGEASVEGSGDATRLAARMIRESVGDVDAPEISKAIQRAALVLLEDGSLVAPIRGEVFVRRAGDDRAGRYVHPGLVALEGLREALARLGIEELDAKGELQHLLAAREPDWAAVWAAARSLPLESALEAFTAQLAGPPEYRLRVRTAAGAWVMPAKALLPGRVIPADGGRDRAYLIDPEFHASDMALLRLLGAVSEPVRRPEPLLEPWRQLYEDESREAFREESHRTRSSRPDPTKVVVSGRPPMWPLALLPALSPEGRAEMTAVVMADGVPDEWSVKHASAKSYGTMPIVSPDLWYLRRFGYIRTSFGDMRPDESLVADPEWSADVLPVAEMSLEAAAALGAKRSPDSFDSGVWAQLKTVADEWEDDNRRVELYRCLEGRIDLDEVVVRVGPRRVSVPVSQVGVTADPDVYGSLLEAHEPAILVRDEAHAADFRRLGMRDGSVVLRQEVVPVPSGEPTTLLDTYRLLQMYLDLADHGLVLQRCSRLTRLVSTPEGQVERPLAAARDGDRLFVTAAEPATELQQVSDVLKLGLSHDDIARCSESAASDEARTLRRRIRTVAGEDLDQALVDLVGVEELVRSLPRQAFAVLRESVESDPRRVAGLARSVHGAGILRHFTDVLQARRMEPPRAFSGGPSARRFVTELGLPEQWAGFIPRPRPATEVVEGRPELPDLHDYQRVVMANIKRLLSGVGPERGMVSLPTGAGKTRVAVQALVEQIRDSGLDGPVVWIAQSDELCEQAAESWSFLWRAIGPALPLAIGRLWADNEIEEQSSAQQVVIATDHKLLSIMQRESDAPAYEWLQRASVVVVDEAHTSVSQKYVKVLDWLGRDAGKKRSGRPLIGLSATPFRGNDSAETRRLAAKYDHNRLDDGAFSGEPYAELQEMGVLARVKPRTLEGVEHVFNEAELEEIDTYGRFPATVERSLGASEARNRTIVDSIAGLPDDWTVLLFATSVENARTLAALLSHRGIPSVSVSADTEPAARRHYVDEFRAGRIRVLTNHSVLTQGFDAPAVRAVYVTRPTFSPNVYQQMVGRGLRGVRNGGSEEVLIVNVEDNFNTYGDKLAFREFDDVWRL